jgi:hypothetical protein
MASARIGQLRYGIRWESPFTSYGKGERTNMKNKCAPIDLFVFAGQSNMMGAAVLAPQDNRFTDQALEYKYLPRLRGAATGSFVKAQHPAGEWHYKDTDKAYGERLHDQSYRSTLGNYDSNTHFCPAMRNENIAFADQSEATAEVAASIPPYFVTEYARLGHACVYAHMAKGGVPIDYFYNAETADRYNQKILAYNEANGTSYATVSASSAGDAFDAKYLAMQKDYADQNPGRPIQNRCFMWLQGESDAACSTTEYRLRLEALWEHLQDLGFTHFFLYRVGFWGSAAILNVIKAQEEFCHTTKNCYVVTRAPSLVTYPGLTTENWWIKEPTDEYGKCRDHELSNISNHHFNEKAFKLFAKRSAENVHRLLHLGLEPVLEEENIKGMMDQKNADASSATGA